MIDKKPLISCEELFCKKDKINHKCNSSRYDLYKKIFNSESYINFGWEKKNITHPIHLIAEFGDIYQLDEHLKFLKKELNNHEINKIINARDHYTLKTATISLDNP